MSTIVKSYLDETVLARELWRLWFAVSEATLGGVKDKKLLAAARRASAIVADFRRQEANQPPIWSDAYMDEVVSQDS